MATKLVANNRPSAVGWPREQTSNPAVRGKAQQARIAKGATSMPIDINEELLNRLHIRMSPDTKEALRRVLTRSR